MWTDSSYPFGKGKIPDKFPEREKIGLK